MSNSRTLLRRAGGLNTSTAEVWWRASKSQYGFNISPHTSTFTSRGKKKIIIIWGGRGFTYLPLHVRRDIPDLQLAAPAKKKKKKRGTL